MKILVVTGASGGHIFPALSLIEALAERDRGIEMLLVLPKRSLRAEALPARFKVKHISISNLKMGFSFKNLIAVFDFLKGSLESLFLMIEFRPDVVVGFGSLNSIPLVILAWLFRTKTLIHEQNVIPGRANKLLSKFADKIAISFAETKDYLKVSPERIVFTGNPIRKDLKRISRQEALKFFGFHEDKFTILVVGGSQGSHRINVNFQEAVSLLAASSGFQVIHLSGAKDFDPLLEKYEDSDINFRLYPFLKEMQYAYSASDLAITRAGATTISELLFFRSPAIIIPYPYAYAHQLSNARVLERMKTAIVIKDEELEAEDLKETLEDLMSNPDKIRQMRQNFSRDISLDADLLLAKEVLA